MANTNYRFGVARMTGQGLVWYPFGYSEPRLAKPHPCFTDLSPRLQEIEARLKDIDPSWSIREATKAERDNCRIAEEIDL